MMKAITGVSIGRHIAALLHSLYAQTTLANKPEFILRVVQCDILLTY